MPILPTEEKLWREKSWRDPDRTYDEVIADFEAKYPERAWHDNDHLLPVPRKIEVPKGLTKCPRCGGWRGEYVDPNPPAGEPPQVRTVSCQCEANICEKCGRRVYKYRLGSNRYDEATGRIWHIPGLCGMMHTCKKPN
jgi:hypothetical protein